jgi:hypothetical protein
MSHKLLAHSAEEQCPFITPNGTSGHLHCALKTGHQSLGFDHVDGYEAHAGETTSWHTEWFAMPAEERLRLTESINLLAESINRSGGAA